jgi:hypothetical protein
MSALLRNVQFKDSRVRFLRSAGICFTPIWHVRQNSLQWGNRTALYYSLAAAAVSGHAAKEYLAVRSRLITLVESQEAVL